MSKKVKLPLIYLIGMALVVVGFIVPMFKLGPFESNGFDFIDFDNFGLGTICALLIFIGALCGVVLCFVNVSNGELLKLVVLLVSIAGFVVLAISSQKNGLNRFLAKGLFKTAYVGFYMMIAGWVIALAGYFTKK
ncbi:hypothetical protein [Treponema sp.]|uniref:hypothetical protein n=1 Tax=Treponema sp. TaxID=166 RepID=UPI0025EBF6E9|nr:hypothetical protein [Treponema sp.]MCR5218669.1 hypothetical protein [Treponema sp.]